MRRPPDGAHGHRQRPQRFASDRSESEIAQGDSQSRRWTDTLCAPIGFEGGLTHSWRRSCGNVRGTRLHERRAALRSRGAPTRASVAAPQGDILRLRWLQWLRLVWLSQWHLARTSTESTTYLALVVDETSRVKVTPLLRHDLRHHEDRLGRPIVADFRKVKISIRETFAHRCSN